MFLFFPDMFKNPDSSPGHFRTDSVAGQYDDIRFQ
jgi:hypothetical protein